MNMTDGYIPAIDCENLRAELCNWLRLLEISGVEDVILKGCAAQPTLAAMGSEIIGIAAPELSAPAEAGGHREGPVSGLGPIPEDALEYGAGAISRVGGVARPGGAPGRFPGGSAGGFSAEVSGEGPEEAPGRAPADGIPSEGHTLSAQAGRPEVTGTSPVGTSPGSSVGVLSDLIDRMSACTRCDLHKTRNNMVFGEGDPSSRLMFVGEGPGRDEDLQGRPFVGRAGMLLTKIIQAMGLERKDVYITNIVKCRPPGNRNPEPDEISECLPYLEKQIDLIEPEVICTLGNVATQTLTGMRSGITSMRGRFYDYRGVRLMPTFHPAACLRRAATKRYVWEDIKKIMDVLGLPIRGVMKDGSSKNKH
jgi:uracil-DNA glycosylase family 4